VAGQGPAGARITQPGDDQTPPPTYAPVVVWLVAAALVAQLVTAIIAVWRHPT
jgi:hypothetical protein